MRERHRQSYFIRARASVQVNNMINNTPLKPCARSISVNMFGYMIRKWRPRDSERAVKSAVRLTSLCFEGFPIDIIEEAQQRRMGQLTTEFRDHSLGGRLPARFQVWIIRFDDYYRRHCS